MEQDITVGCPLTSVIPTGSRLVSGTSRCSRPHSEPEAYQAGLGMGSMKRFTQIREAVQIFLILTAFPLDHVAVMGMLAAPQRRRAEPLQESPVDVIRGPKRYVNKGASLVR